MYSYVILGVENDFHIKNSVKRFYVPQSLDVFKKIGVVEPPLAYVPSSMYDRSIPCNNGGGEGGCPNAPTPQLTVVPL